MDANWKNRMIQRKFYLTLKDLIEKLEWYSLHKRAYGIDWF